MKSCEEVFQEWLNEPWLTDKQTRLEYIHENGSLIEDVKWAFAAGFIYGSNSKVDEK